MYTETYITATAFDKNIVLVVEEFDTNTDALIYTNTIRFPNTFDGVVAMVSEVANMLKVEPRAKYHYRSGLAPTWF